jgi:hypothetical protein
MKPQIIHQLIAGRVGKTLTITFVSGEVVNAKIISADRELEEDVDFYFIDLDRAPGVEFMDERPDEDSSMRAHVYGGSYREVRDVEIPHEV